MSAAHFYPVGTSGKAWGGHERVQWLNLAVVKRSYAEDVLAKLELLKAHFDVEQYGALSQDPGRYPLFAIKTRGWDAAAKPCVLVTGGTHGYETSGVQGALLFAATQMAHYAKWFNIAVCPCVSPWSYECIQRWNAATIDPNRSYVPDSPCEESGAVVRYIAKLAVPRWQMHVDLHETTDTDDTEFRPAKASRDGATLEPDSIPDGFYLIGNSAEPQAEWHKAMIDAVRKITHIAPAEADGTIVGLPMAQEGVVLSSTKGLGKFVTNAPFVTTTEVYPDSKIKLVTGEQCNRAQVAAVVAGLEYIIDNVITRSRSADGGVKEQLEGKEPVSI